MHYKKVCGLLCTSIQNTVNLTYCYFCFRFQVTQLKHSRLAKTATVKVGTTTFLSQLLFSDPYFDVKLFSFKVCFELSSSSWKKSQKLQIQKLQRYSIITSLKWGGILSNTNELTFGGCKLTGSQTLQFMVKCRMHNVANNNEL